MNDINHYEVKQGIKPVSLEGFSQVQLYSESLTSLLKGTKNAGDRFVHGLKKTFFSLPGTGMKTLTSLIHDGKKYLFDPMYFWTICKTYCDVQERNNEIHWHIIRMTMTGLIEIQVTAQKKNMRPVDMPEENGTTKGHYMHCHNAIGSIEICKKNIWGEKVTLDRLFMDDVYCLYEIGK